MVKKKSNSLFVVLLKFSENKGKAPDFMDGHNDWIEQGINDGKFLLIGSLKPNLGGAVLVSGLSLSQVQKRVNADPFVSENVVKAEILEISIGMMNDKLECLLEENSK